MESSKIQISQELYEAVHSKNPASGLYAYLLQIPCSVFSRISRRIIEDFSNPGDTVLDPFMGSGTTLVEALTLQRNSIGNDINPLAHFVAKVKTTPLNDNEIAIIQNWSINIVDNLNIHKPSFRDSWWIERGYQRHLPWRIRKLLEQIIESIQTISCVKAQNFIKCAALSTGKWALDCKKTFPTADEFRNQLTSTIEDFITGIKALQDDLKCFNSTSRAICLNEDASKLNFQENSNELGRRPSLVITSPPYPGVHILYHRWQILGRKETAAPYWITGTPDGHGVSFYTLGGRSKKGVNRYFNSIKKTYKTLHPQLSDNALVFQLVGFNNIESQLPRYLEAMHCAGFSEVDISLNDNKPAEGDVVNSDGRLWRQVPHLRKWYASLKGNNNASREFLLVHRKNSTTQF